MGIWPVLAKKVSGTEPNRVESDGTQRQIESNRTQGGKSEFWIFFDFQIQ